MLGVILAGGASTRMGTDKAMVEVAGRPMLEWVASALRSVVPETVVAGRADPVAGLVAIPDLLEPYSGPLAGLLAVATARPEEALLLVAVDQPWVRSVTLAVIAGSLGARPSIPVEHGVRQVLCAAYPPGLAELASEELAALGSLQSLLDVTSFDPLTGWAAHGEDGRSWYSADSPEAITEGLARFGPPTG